MSTYIYVLVVARGGKVQVDEVGHPKVSRKKNDADGSSGRMVLRVRENAEKEVGLLMPTFRALHLRRILGVSGKRIRRNFVHRERSKMHVYNVYRDPISFATEDMQERMTRSDCGQ